MVLVSEEMFSRISACFCQFLPRDARSASAVLPVLELQIRYGGPENMASDSEPEKIFGVAPLKGPPKLQKIDIIAVGNDYKILIHFK